MMSALVALVLPLALGAQREASESFTLETHVYVYRNSDFQEVKIPGAAAIDETRGVIFRSPVNVQFDQEKLSLDGPRYAWSGGHNPPNRFGLIGTPTVPVTRGKPVTLLSSEPFQYLEKLPNGTLQVREIPRDSPEAPHCRFTFTIGRTSDASEDLPLECDLDIATVSARQKLPGVTLDVGKPELARFKEKLAPKLRPEEWSALLLRTPNRTDYSLLVLLKIVPEGVPGAKLSAEQTRRLMTEAELDNFAAAYYRNPRPELIGDAIEAFGQSGFLNDRGPVFIGFFAEVFAANPERIGEWQKLIERQEKPVRDLLKDVVKLSRPGAILGLKAHTVRINDMRWGAFFASGNTAYLRKLVDSLLYMDEGWDRDLFWAGATAMWSLARNAPEHPLVRPTLEAAKAEEKSARVRLRIDEVLTKDLPVIKQQIAEILKGRNFRQPFGGGGFFDGIGPKTYEGSYPPPPAR